MDSIVTPPNEALPILSQIATSKLKNTREVALRGSSKLYWSFVRFHTILGTMESPYVDMLHELISNQAEAEALANVDILSRVSSINTDTALKVTRVGIRGIPTVAQPTAEPITEVAREGEGLPSSLDTSANKVYHE